VGVEVRRRRPGSESAHRRVRAQNARAGVAGDRRGLPVRVAAWAEGLTSEVLVLYQVITVTQYDGGMLLFDLTHDRMAATPVEVVADVQAALIFDESRYLDAARKIGLNAQERAELEDRVTAGELERTTLPTHLDAMAGMHHGRIYAVRNVRVRAGEAAFVIVLADGKRVYVPMTCGNLSVTRGAPRRVVAQVRVPARPQARVPVARVAAARVVLPVETVPAPVAPVMPVAVANVSAAVVAPIEAAVHTRNFSVPFFAWLTGSLEHVATGSAPSLPACGASRTSDAGACVGN
jgi:hypothetical protein